MKQKTLLILFIIIVSAIFTFLGTNLVYAAGEDTTSMVFEKVNGKEAVDVSMNITKNEGVSSFQTSIKIASNQLADIKNVNINWATNINKNALLKTANYDKNTGILSIYVVSKTELTQVNEAGNIVLNLGTITFGSKNTTDMTIDMIAGNTVFGDIAHNSRNITADGNAEKISLTITAKEIPTNPDDPNKPTDPSNPDDPNKPTDPSDPSNPGGNTQDPNDPSNPGSGDQNNNSGNNNNQNQGNNNSQKDNQSKGKLPFAGGISPKTIMMIALFVLIVAIITVLLIQKHKKRSN